MKLVSTPCGKFVMPINFEEEIEKMTDDKLIEKLIENERQSAHGFIDPFKLQFVIDKGLYSKYLKARNNKSNHAI